MAKHNQFPGYIALPKKRKAIELNVRLDFNGQIEAKPGRAELKGFHLRMFVLKKKIGGPDLHPEMGVYLRPEEWLDLIDAMKDEYERVDKGRRQLEKTDDPEDSNEW
jgi:hypothetical protein